MTTPEQLAQSDLFSGLNEQQLASICALCSEITYEAGAILFEEGTAATQVYVLLEGKVGIQVQLSSRPERLTTSLLSQFGQLVGWSGFMPPNIYTATAVCQDNTRLLVLDGAAFMAVLEADPAMGFVIMRRIAGIISGRLRNIQRFVLKTL
ncbi:MAG: cyclic nucleotide-binding domain-containing protein [Anaerolineae bacterium]|nr:cyclic nucleotide-binding domain-containing protein [Anaerolineae bacterium]